MFCRLAWFEQGEICCCVSETHMHANHFLCSQLRVRLWWIGFVWCLETPQAPYMEKSLILLNSPEQR